MRAWKIIVVGVILRVAFIIAIAVVASNGFALGATVVNHGTSSRQRQMSMINLVNPAEKTDVAATPNSEPRGPFRAIGW
jgi:hypothetical protein